MDQFYHWHYQARIRAAIRFPVTSEKSRTSGHRRLNSVMQSQGRSSVAWICSSFCHAHIPYIHIVTYAMHRSSESSGACTDTAIDNIICQRGSYMCGITDTTDSYSGSTIGYHFTSGRVGSNVEYGYRAVDTNTRKAGGCRPPDPLSLSEQRKGMLVAGIGRAFAHWIRFA